MWAYNLGYSAGTPSWNQTENYNNSAFSGGSSGGSGMGSMWGGIISGIGNYASATAQAGALENQSKLSAQAQLDQLKQQREYQLQDKQYKKDAVSRWSKFFG